jgi:hypothetical protein
MMSESIGNIQVINRYGNLIINVDNSAYLVAITGCHSNRLHSIR